MAYNKKIPPPSRDGLFTKVDFYILIDYITTTSDKFIKRLNN
jgi:hypothetical protein